MSLLRGLQPPVLTLVPPGNDPRAPCKKVFLNCIFRLLQGYWLWPVSCTVLGCWCRDGVLQAPLGAPILSCPHLSTETPAQPGRCSRVLMMWVGVPLLYFPAGRAAPRGIFSWAEG